MPATFSALSQKRSSDGFLASHGSPQHQSGDDLRSGFHAQQAHRLSTELIFLDRPKKGAPVIIRAALSGNPSPCPICSPISTRHNSPPSRCRAACPDPCRCRQRQDARPDHAHRLADLDRAGRAAGHPGGDLHQQGGEGNAVAPRGDAADQHARHVDRHLSRSLQPPPARALTARPGCRRSSRFSMRPTSWRRSSAC
jgi:hypothetical protein